MLKRFLPLLLVPVLAGCAGFSAGPTSPVRAPEDLSVLGSFYLESVRADALTRLGQRTSNEAILRDLATSHLSWVAAAGTLQEVATPGVVVRLEGLDPADVTRVHLRDGVTLGLDYGEFSCQVRVVVWEDPDFSLRTGVEDRGCSR